MCTKIKGIFEMNKMFNKNICLKRCLCMYFADNQWVLLIANLISPPFYSFWYLFFVFKMVHIKRTIKRHFSFLNLFVNSFFT